MAKTMSLKEFLEEVKAFSGHALVQCTDGYHVLNWPASDLNLVEGKLLEIRIFNEKKEERLFRLDLGDQFYYHVTQDDSLDPKKDYFDQQQILDIDTTQKLEGDWVASTGGGKYTLPKKIFENSLGKAAILIRHYFGVTSTGQAYIRDFRCVKFVVAKTMKWSELLGGKNGKV